LVGNATEKAALQAMEWTIGRGGAVAMPLAGKRTNVEIHKRFHFNSQLKRMSSVVKTDDGYMVFTKGAPEVMEPLMSVIDTGRAGKAAAETYEDIHNRFSRQGLRVLALAAKKISAAKPSDIQSLSREECESGLTYAGLALFRCPLKADSKESIIHLQQGSNQCMMITGDHALTACHVAKELSMTTEHVLRKEKPMLLLSGKPAEGPWQWEDVATGKVPRPFTPAGCKALANTFALCLDGAAIASLEEAEELSTVVSYVTVWARTSPRQKEGIVQHLRALGKAVLMCGDGTNDVGALKAAEVGVGLINMQTLQASVVQAPPNPKLNYAEQLAAQEEAEQRARTPNFGDASIASPFTAKRPSISSCIDVIRQGRCTLVSTMQMFKILGINCLVSAYCLSVLFMDGLKWGDTQMTLQGLCVAGFFFFISRAKPLRTLSSQRPPSNVFSAYMIFSIIGQMLVHLYVLMEAVALVKADASWSHPVVPYSPYVRPTADDSFRPSVFNTVVYLTYSCILLSIFTVNYSGHPHMQSLTENKAMLYGISVNWLINILLTLGAVPYLTETFELVPIPKSMFNVLCQLQLVDFCVTLVIEKVAYTLLA